MKTKKSIWSIALVVIMVLALVLSFGLSSQRATVKAEEPVDHITFNVTVDGVNEKTIESNHPDLLVVRYTVTENTGVDAMQLRIDFSSAFTLERIEALKTTSLGEPTITNGTKVNEPINGENYVAYENITLEENNIYIGANIVYEHVNNTYSATGDTLIIAYYRLNNNPTEGVYPFGFWNANNGDGFSTAWKNVANAEQSGTHTPVIINYADAVVYIMGDYVFTLTGGQKVYDGVPAENSAITVSDNNNQNRPTLNYVWFEGISSNSDTYRKLDSNPVNAGQYFVVLEYEATNRYRAYKGYTQTAEPGVYTLDSTQGKVATYIITQRSITITATAQSADYTGTEPTVNQSAYTVVDNEDVKLENIASLVSGVNISKVEGVNAGNYTLTPSLENSNYNITFVNGTFTINPKAITIKIDDKSSKYRAPLAELTWGLKTGSTLVGDDQLEDLNVELSTTPADLSNANVGPYPISGTYNNANYTVTFENGTYTIESVGKDAEYIFSFIEGLTKNYNGSVQDLLNILAQNANEEVKPAWISYSVSNNQQKNAGDYVIPVSVTLSQEVADNYTNGVKEFATTVNGKINKIALTITASAEVEYDDLEPFIWVNQGNGWANGENYDTYDEELEMNLEDYVGSNYTRGQNAGTPYTISWNGNAEAYVESVLTNYDVTLAVAQNLTVAKQVVDAEDYDFAGYTGDYDAQNHNLIIENADSKISVSISNKATVKDVADTGVYTATITLADPDNYTFDDGSHEGWTVSGNSASKQAQVTISAKQLEISVNYTDSKTATFSLSGFAVGETAEVLTGLVYKADGAVSANISGNVYAISEYVANAIAISATSSNTNYTIKDATLRNIRKVEYVCDHDLGTNMPADELLFNGFKAVQPEAVSLTHYTFKGYKVANNKDAGNFDYNQNIEENKTIYVVFVENEKYSLTLYYMVEGDAEHLTQVGEVLEFYSDDAIRYGHELPSMTAKDWFKVQEWYTDEALETKYVEGTLSDDLTLYANYKFNIGLGDVNANGLVNANDITLYRQWIVGGYGEIEVEDGAEWALVNSDAYKANKASEAPKAYFVKRVADSNALTAESTVLGDAHFDIRDVSTIRMGLVGGYGFAIVEGKTVDGEALLVTRTVTIDSVSDLLAVARSGRAVQLAGDITEENFVGAIVNCGNDVVIDLNNHEITVKSLSISLAENNTGKIEIKNGRINVADGNGVHLSAPAGSIVLDNVTLYDRDGIFELQAADHSLHFNNEVKFLKDEQGVKVPAAVKVENGTHVVVEEAATLEVAYIEVVSKNDAPEAAITIEVKTTQEAPIAVIGNVEMTGETTEENVVNYVCYVMNGQEKVYYSTIQEAVNAANGETTIYLNGNINGNGVIVNGKNITFDFNGYTYTVDKNTVGSTGTETNGFQLLKDSTVTFKNGTLKTTTAKILIQNYANTTLDNFTVSGEGAEQLQYVTSNNFGSLTVKDGSKILADGNQVAFDLWYGMSAVYDDGVTVTLKAGSEVVGKVEYGAQQRTLNNNMPIKANLVVEDGAVWGKEITLSSDVYVDHQIVIDKDLTLNLNGKTVKYVGDETLTSGLFGVKRGATLTINDTKGTGKIDASSNKIYAAVAITLKGEAATGEKAKVIVNGGTLEGYYYAIVGNGSRHNTEVVVNNGTLYGINGTAIYNPQDGLVTINNGHIKGLDTAIEIRAGQLVINDGVFEALSQVYSVTANGSGTTVVGAIIAISQHTTLKNITVTINGGTFTNGICAFAIVDTTDTSNNNLINVIINGGTFNNDQVINNLAELKAFRDAVNAGNNFAGKTITLNADITLNGAWTPISNYSRKDSANQSKWFAGTFDGNGHTISGLTNANLVAGNITEKEEYTYGLFGSVNNAVIKNLTLTNVSISASNGDSLGALVGYYANGTQKAEANISNITISGSVYGSDNVGGVVGRASGSYFKASNVTVSGTVEADYKASGLVGTGNANEMVFENCTNSANVSSTTVRADNAGYNAVAGISITWKDACQKVVLIECVNTGAISTINENAIYGQLAVDYSPQTDMNENGTWTYANGHWTRA